MNEYGIQESWTKKLVLHCNYNFKFDRILGTMKYLRLRILEPLRCLENGEIVVICRNLHATCYIPSTEVANILNLMAMLAPSTNRFHMFLV